MGRHKCELCEMYRYSEATECGCYERLCESCLEQVCGETSCQYCVEGDEKSCDECEMVSKTGAWLSCPAKDCPLLERLHDN